MFAVGRQAVELPIERYHQLKAASAPVVDRLARLIDPQLWPVKATAPQTAGHLAPVGVGAVERIEYMIQIGLWFSYDRERRPGRAGPAGVIDLIMLEQIG